MARGSLHDIQTSRPVCHLGLQRPFHSINYAELGTMPHLHHLPTDALQLSTQVEQWEIAINTDGPSSFITKRVGGQGSLFIKMRYRPLTEKQAYRQQRDTDRTSRFVICLLLHGLLGTSMYIIGSTLYVTISTKITDETLLVPAVIAAMTVR